MDRKDLDINGLSKSFARNSVIITCSGSDEGFQVYQHALTSHLLRNALVWKRNGKVFPHLLTFPLKFVPFDEKLCFGPHVNPSQVYTIAYIHMFNINVSTLEEYKLDVRHNVSDWFAKLNSKSDVQWMITINTSNIKDRKTKTSIMDKIKSDFSKYQTRLIELPDVGDHTGFMGLVQAVIGNLFTHLNMIVDVWDRSLKNLFEKRKTPNWDCAQYFESMTEYGRFHWSFGAIEFSMSIFDDLEHLIDEFINSTDPPNWVQQLSCVEIDDKPNLIGTLGLRGVENTKHYMGMRNYILAQQILMAIQAYQQKMKSNDAAPSIRSDCVVDILRRTLVCVKAVKEFDLRMKKKGDEAKTSCWVWWTVTASMDICNLLCDISHLDIARELLSRLYLEKFEAISQLSCLIGMEDSDKAKKVIEWLNKGEELKQAKLLDKALSSVESMSAEMERIHDVCVNELHQSNRYRIGMHVTLKFFDFLKRFKLKCPIHKLAMTKKMRAEFPCQKTTSVMLKNLFDLERVDEMHMNRNEIIGMIYFISRCESGMDANVNEKFMELCRAGAKQDGNMIRWNDLTNDDRFEMKMEPFEPIQTINEQCRVVCRLQSTVGFDLGRSVIRLKFSSSTNAQICHPKELSILASQYDTKENISRLVSKKKKSREKDDCPQMCMELTVDELKNGMNELVFETKIECVGCFVLETIEIVTEDCLRFETSHVAARQAPLICCIWTPHVMNVVNDAQPFLAGVVQRIVVEIEAKGDIERETQLVVSSPSGSNDLRFLDRSTMTWTNSIKASIKAMEALEKTRFSIFALLRIGSSNCEAAAVQKKSFFVEWMERKYNLSVNFVPLMVITSKTSMLTTDILLEVEVHQASGGEYETKLIKADLNAIEAATGEMIAAESLTKMPIECEHLSIVDLVWKLPLKGVGVKHALHAEYSIRSRIEFEEFDENEQAMIEAMVYEFDDEVELNVPDISFEICTQVLSQQPGAQLCRAGSPCHYVISIRCLKDMPCTLLIVLEADERIWALSERTKVVNVKDSGLGQVALSVVPVMAGFLPFPTVSIYECQQNPVSADIIMPGQEILCFNRTAGKQIRVLSSNNEMTGGVAAKEDTSRASNRITKKIVKLFD